MSEYLTQAEEKAMFAAEKELDASLAAVKYASYASYRAWSGARDRLFEEVRQHEKDNARLVELLEAYRELAEAEKKYTPVVVEWVSVRKPTDESRAEFDAALERRDKARAEVERLEGKA